MINEELGRHKAALDIAFKALNLVATASDVSLTAVNTCAETALAKIADILPPEFEEVEVVRWMCDSCEEVYDMDPAAHGWAKCGAELNKHGGDCANNNYVKLTGILKRPVKRPVVRKVSVAAVLHPVDGSTTAFRNHPECHGKTGTLIFCYTE